MKWKMAWVTAKAEEWGMSHTCDMYSNTLSTLHLMTRLLLDIERDYPHHSIAYLL